jgi:hypothetical protein
MESTPTCGRVALLRLQPVLPLCNDAIKRFMQSESIDSNLSIKVTSDPKCDVYSWIDSTLFTSALKILFKDLLNCPCFEKQINVELKQIGLSTCRIIIAQTEKPDLSVCDGPYHLSSCPWHECDIEDSNAIISMHGGYIQAWKIPETQKCFFEINLVCMNGNEEVNYDRI